MAHLVLEVEHTALRNFNLVYPHHTSMQLDQEFLPQPSAAGNDGVDPGVVCTRKGVDQAVSTAVAAKLLRPKWRRDLEGLLLVG